MGMIEQEALEIYDRGYIGINLDYIYQNIVNIKKHIKEDSGIVAVLKTDGYGHGAVPIARVIDELVTDYAVATVEEGINLREHGFEKPMYLLGFTYPGKCEAAVQYDIIPAVFQYEMALEWSKAAQKYDKTVKINIAVDTGMGRIGFLPNEESLDVIAKIAQLPGIEIYSIFTHFCKADYKDKTSANGQYKLFTEFITKLEKRNIIIPVHMCANSAAIIDLPEYSMNRVRAGIVMYGLNPSDEVTGESVQVKPALSMKSRIVHIKEVEAGTPISYGSTYVTSKRERIATIPVGYGDGYQRNLSNKGYVLIHGQKAPICGRICMDQFMVNVTDIKEAKLWDEVTLIGKDGELEITVEELSKLAGTFNYEFVCDLSKRVPRVYFHQGKIICKKDHFDDKYTF